MASDDMEEEMARLRLARNRQLPKLKGGGRQAPPTTMPQRLGLDLQSSMTGMAPRNLLDFTETALRASRSVPRALLKRPKIPLSKKYLEQNMTANTQRVVQATRKLKHAQRRKQLARSIRLKRRMEAMKIEHAMKDQQPSNPTWLYVE